MNRIKSLLLLFVAMAVMNIFVSAEARAEKKIGILIFSEESRYVEAKRGILDQLEKDGYKEPSVVFTIENARGSKAKVVEVAQKFSTMQMDLIFSLGTSATIPLAREIKDVPVVFAFVFDPVVSGIVEDWKSSGNNITGASARVPMSILLDTLKEFRPVTRLAVLYTPGEKNSEAQLRELQKLQDQYQIKIIPSILMKKEEIDHLLPEIARTADAIFLTGSSIIGESVFQIVDIANRTKVVTISFLDDLVEKGALLGVCTNSYQLGRLAGMKAVKILKGAKPSAIPIESGNKIDVILNMKTLKAGQYPVTPAFMKKVTRMVE